MHVSGTITSVHANAENVAQSLSPDNGGFMTVTAVDGCVVAKISGESLRSVIATVDDYLVNLSVSERLS
ncbi:hypothetical protein McpSp1_15830 [Methanocorpusculaceae archaeon Sp1]|uniref:Uncharacterized protein n=1 Tax=Methanorbis furvi TaxID=3028299 RepID=A0AAE4SB07_9EURY|nr:hypothetical protein [Methanocorpusculaceae archaeon Sp1]MDV0442233.1 hypothetical protein [Methanocorpusculaceae archaeon Ag1]